MTKKPKFRPVPYKHLHADAAFKKLGGVKVPMEVVNQLPAMVVSGYAKDSIHFKVGNLSYSVSRHPDNEFIITKITRGGAWCFPVGGFNLNEL